MEIAAGLDEAEDDFDSRKHIVEILNVHAALTIEGEERVACVSCVFKNISERMVLAPMNKYTRMKLENHNSISEY